jgi:hypothetical protein
MTDTTQTKMDKAGSMTRRQVLAKLGLAAAVAYTAPVMLQLGEAKASSFSGGRRRGGSNYRRRRSFS